MQLWFYAIFMFTTTRNGVAAKELQRQLGVTYKTAWRMGHKIREHMALVDGDGMLEGQVEVDETYVGGYRRGGQGAIGQPAFRPSAWKIEGRLDVITEVIT